MKQEPEEEEEEEEEPDEEDLLNGSEGNEDEDLDDHDFFEQTGDQIWHQKSLYLPVTKHSIKTEKCLSLYEDAKDRILRKDHIYANCNDKECTFKP